MCFRTINLWHPGSTSQTECLPHFCFSLLNWFHSRYSGLASRFLVIFHRLKQVFSLNLLDSLCNIHKEILKEADLPNSPGLSKDNSFIENILIAFTNIISKFQQLFQKKRSAQAEFIKNSQNNIKECNNFGYCIY